MPFGQGENMLETMLRMLIILLVLTVITLIFQEKGTSEFYVSLMTIILNILGIFLIRNQMKNQQNHHKL